MSHLNELETSKRSGDFLDVLTLLLRNVITRKGSCWKTLKLRRIQIVRLRYVVSLTVSRCRQMVYLMSTGLPWMNYKVEGIKNENKHR